MPHHDLNHIIIAEPDTDNLWSGTYKIPWDDAAFSARMLKEHLTQDHDLASRKDETITAQCQWIDDRFRQDSPIRILDICCGPGLYSHRLTREQDTYTGMDFGPASIEYATTHYGDTRHVFSLGNVETATLEGPYDIILMIYGEFNVFPPATCRDLMCRAYGALAPGGVLAVEPHRKHAVKAIGNAGPSWYACESGLFSDAPHICLTKHHWIEEEQVAQSMFHIIDAATSDVATYRNTMQAWSDEEYLDLMHDAGFTEVTIHEDWPCQNECHMLLSGRKPR